MGAYRNLRAVRAAAPFVFCIVLLVGPPALAQSGQGDAQVEMLSGVVLTNPSELDFGSIIPGNTASTLVIDEDSGALAVTGSATPVGNRALPAIFSINGEPGQRVKIQLDDKSVTITRQGGTETMTVSKFKLDVKKNSTLDANGKLQFKVGGQLGVAAAQAAGTYSGNFEVTVEYR